MQSRPRRYMPDWIWPLLVIVVVLALPLLIPIAIFDQIICKRRLHKAAKSFACTKCGKTLGNDAVKRADEVWSAHVSELMRTHPGVRFRMVRTTDAICLDCGTEYTFRKREGTFVVAEPRLSGVRA
jgi:hypothetical protein